MSIYVQPVLEHWLALGFWGAVSNTKAGFVGRVSFLAGVNYRLGIF